MNPFRPGQAMFPPFGCAMDAHSPGDLILLGPRKSLPAVLFGWYCWGQSERSVATRYPRLNGQARRKRLCLSLPGHFRSRFPLGPIFRRIEGVALTAGNSTGKVAPEGRISSMGPKSEVHRGGSFPANSDMLLLCSKRRCPGLERVIARRHVLYGKVAVRAGD